MTYWAQNINQESNGKIQAEVITATPQTQKKGNVFYVPDTKKVLLSKIIKDAGTSWYYDLKHL